AAFAEAQSAPSATMPPVAAPPVNTPAVVNRAPAPQPPALGNNGFPEPKKVKVVSVRPDGSIIGSDPAPAVGASLSPGGGSASAGSAQGMMARMPAAASGDEVSSISGSTDDASAQKSRSQAGRRTQVADASDGANAADTGPAAG